MQGRVSVHIGTHHGCISTNFGENFKQCSCAASRPGKEADFFAVFLVGPSAPGSTTAATTRKMRLGARPGPRSAVARPGPAIKLSKIDGRQRAKCKGAGSPGNLRGATLLHSYGRTQYLICQHKRSLLQKTGFDESRLGSPLRPVKRSNAGEIGNSGDPWLTL